MEFLLFSDLRAQIRYFRDMVVKGIKICAVCVLCHSVNETWLLNASTVNRSKAFEYSLNVLTEFVFKNII